jgi:broad specificity phosphatase PhoE
MPRLYLVRHAKPAASWAEEPDPGLDETGIGQARATAQQLAASLPRLAIYTSPLRRCRETASPLEELWQRPATPMASVAEIPSPPLDQAARRAWLSAAVRGTWKELRDTAPPGSIDYLQWRDNVIDALAAVTHDCVICTHFIAINAAVGAATAADAVLCFRPDHASVTVFDTDGRRLRLVELGRQADTSVLTRQ